MLQIALQKAQDYWANGWHALLVVLALVYILICVKDKSVKKTFLWYSGLFVAIFFCPLTMKIITKFIGELVYWRMFWLLPTSVIMAFAFTHWYEKVSAKWLKAVVAIVISLVVALSGAWVYTNAKFVPAPNWHKVVSAVPGVCETIQNDAAEQGFEKRPRAVVVNSLVAYIRQYDAGIRMPYGRNAHLIRAKKRRGRLYAQMQQEIPDYKKLKKLLKQLKCNYVVWRGNEESFAGFEENGFRLVGEVETYKVFFLDIE